MAISERSYAQARCWLDLEGATTGLVESVEGGDATGVVVTQVLGSDPIPRKHLSNVQYPDITIRVGTGMSSSVYDWIDATLRQPYSRKNGAVVFEDFDRNEALRLNFYQAVISEIGFPPLDGASKDAAYITLKITPEYTRRAAGSGLKLSGSNLPKKWISSDFRLQIDGLDCSRVNRIEALTIARIQPQEPVGEMRDYLKEPSSLEIPNLAMTLSENGSDSFRQWHEDFVINGNSGGSAERNGSLEFLGPNLKDVLFTLTFRHLGIFKLTPKKFEAGSDSIRRLRAEMYCEEIDFKQGASLGSGKGAGVAPAAGREASGARREGPEGAAGSGKGSGAAATAQGAAAGASGGGKSAAGASGSGNAAGAAAAAQGAAGRAWDDDKSGAATAGVAKGAGAASTAGGAAQGAWSDDRSAAGAAASGSGAGAASAAGGAAAGAESEDKSAAGPAGSGKGADAGTEKESKTNSLRWRYAELTSEVAAVPSRPGRSLKFRG